MVNILCVLTSMILCDYRFSYSTPYTDITKYRFIQLGTKNLDFERNDKYIVFIMMRGFFFIVLFSFIIFISRHFLILEVIFRLFIF